MLKITEKNNQWIISENGIILFSEIKTLPEALAIAKSRGFVLSEINKKAA